jgi:hypothetical protein
LPLLRGFGGFVGEASGGHFLGGLAFAKGARRKKNESNGRKAADPGKKKTF